MRFLARRGFRSLLTLWAVISLVFVATRVTGDPTLWLLPDDAGPEERQSLRDYLGLNRPLIEQYVIYFGSILQGDFGNSFKERRPVLDMFLERIGATLRLSGLSFLLAVALGLPIGILAALLRNSPLDRGLMLLTFMGQALPNYVLGIIGILVFSLLLRWLPSGGMASWQAYLMPVITLGTASSASIARLTRSSMLDVLNMDYIRTAKAKGLRFPGIILKHALRNGFIAVLTVLGLQVGTLLAGSVIVETVFAWPGMGRLIVSAVQSRDFPVVQFSVFMVAATVVLANTVVDLLYGLLDPRIRLR
ncbi:MAG: ABC transporter permease [Trueperaceae bacterium]|nr:ABC transporter permease [Trueperaceae bacterium]